jgi:hypothetical protein
VGRVRVVFSLPQKSLPAFFPNGTTTPQHLAYVDWFSNFSAISHRDHGLYAIHALERTWRTSSIIPVANIKRSVHLFPSFGRRVPHNWTSDTVLDDCKKFFLNSQTDREALVTLQ